MEPEAPPSQAQAPKKPMLVKASLRHHTPEQIYDYINRHIGDLGMKIKKRQAVIGFENDEFYQKLITEHKVIMLHGKKLEFTPLAKSDENYLMSEEEEVVEMPKLGTGVVCPDFKCINSIEARINSCRYGMMDKVQMLFMPTIQASRQRVEQLRLQFPEEAPRKREMLSLECGVQKKLRALETKYQQDIKNIHKFIHEFSVKPSTIDLEPTFTFEETWQFPKIELKNMRFEPAGFFTNKDYYPCKRLCAVNGNQFVTTMADLKRRRGFAKIYDVNQSDPKEMITMEPGCYGICRANNYLLLGSTDSTIKYINLDDSERSVESSATLSPKVCTFFQVKICKPSAEKPEILVLGTDGMLRKIQISTEEYLPGMFALSFEQKAQITVLEQCVSFQVINPTTIIYGNTRKLTKYHLEKKLTKQIPINQKGVKLKKFSQNLLAVGQTKRVQLLDLRTESIVQSFPPITTDLRALEVIGQHSIMYGSHGEIGLLDDRKHEVFPWKSEAHHKGVVYDILKLKDRVVSCDSEGILHSWKLAGECGPIAPTLGQKPSVQIEFGRT